MVADNRIGVDYWPYFRRFKVAMCLGLLLVVNLLTAQNQNLIDSLQKGLQEDLTDSVRIAYLNELAWQWRRYDGPKALDYANQALELSRTADRELDIATSLNRIGEVYRLDGRYREAIDQFKQALVIEQRNDHQHGVARASSQLGNLYTNLGQYDSALFYSLESLARFQVTNNEPAVGRTHNRIAIIYKNQARYELAIAHSDSALEVQEDNKALQANLAETYMSRGNIYRGMEDLESAMNQYQKSKYIRDLKNDQLGKAQVLMAMGTVYYLQDSLDKALQYYNESRVIKEAMKARGNLDVIYNNIANVYESQERPDSALHYYRLSLEIKELNEDSAGLAINLNNIGNLYKSSSKPEELDSALFYLFESLKYSKAVQDPTAIMETYSNLSEIYAKQGNLQKALEYNDSLLAITEVLNRSIVSAATAIKNYEREKSKREISEQIQKTQAAELQILKSENEQKKLIIFLIAMFLVIIVLGGVFYYRSKIQEQRIVIAEKDKNIANQQMQEIIKEQEINSIHAMIEGQESERKRIAQDLHDRLGSMLSVVKMHYKSVEDNMENLEDQNKTQYQKANALLDEACDEVRKISHDMVSGVLTKFGLIPALKSLAQSVAETGQLDMKVLKFGFGEERLDYDTEITVYRIIQELLSNVLKHAHAQELTVQLIKKNDNLNVVVEDDGIGFDFQEKSASGGMGLAGIASRVEKLHGEMQVDSGRGGGTTITIDIPLNHK